MQDRFGFSIAFEEPFSREAVRTLLTAIRDAVAENWKLYRNEFTTDALVYPIDIESWTDAVFAKPLSYAPPSEGNYWFTSCREMSISPVNSWDGNAWLSFTRYPKCNIGVDISVPCRSIKESLGDREVWQLSRKWREAYVAKFGKEPDVSGPYIGDEEVLGPEWNDWWYERRNELDELPSAFPVARQCILNVRDHLQRALRTESSSLDEELV